MHKLKNTMYKNFTKYEVNDDGRIWSYSRNKFLKSRTDKNGYQQVALTDNEGKIKWYLVHRIVYEAVTGEPIPENLEVNHIDERKDNNARSNLELVSHKENCNFGTRNERMSKANTNGKCSKAVGAYRNGELVLIFPSTAEAGRNGFDFSAVGKCCRGKLKTYKGYTWQYL